MISSEIEAKDLMIFFANNLILLSTKLEQLNDIIEIPNSQKK